MEDKADSGDCFLVNQVKLNKGIVLCTVLLGWEW